MKKDIAIDEMEIEVSVVERQDEVSLVQFQENDDLYRVIIPAKMVKDNLVKQSVLERGIPVGENWEAKLTITLDAQKLSRAMRRRGLFTFADIERLGLHTLQKAVIDAISDDLSNLLAQRS